MLMLLLLGHKYTRSLNTRNLRVNFIWIVFYWAAKVLIFVWSYRFTHTHGEHSFLFKKSLLRFIWRQISWHIYLLQPMSFHFPTKEQIVGVFKSVLARRPRINASPVHENQQHFETVAVCVCVCVTTNNSNDNTEQKITFPIHFPILVTKYHLTSTTTTRTSSHSIVAVVNWFFHFTCTTTLHFWAFGNRRNCVYKTWWLRK